MEGELEKRHTEGLKDSKDEEERGGIHPAAIFPRGPLSSRC